MDLKDIKELIKFVSKSEVSEVKYKDKDFAISIRTGLAGNVSTQYVQSMPLVPQTQQIANPVSIESGSKTETEENNNYITIKSPMIGTFYRKPGPDKNIFVNVGDSVTPGKVVCIIEAMKLFNEIESEISGKIVKVLVEDSSPVEFDQPLFLVDPS